MNEIKHPCEACLGFIPHIRRIRCPKCEKLFCKYHIKNHSCNETTKPLSCNGCDYDYNEDCNEGCCKIE